MNNKAAAERGKSRRVPSAKKQDTWQTVTRGKRSSPKNSPQVTSVGTPPRSQTGLIPKPVRSPAQSSTSSSDGGTGSNSPSLSHTKGSSSRKQTKDVDATSTITNGQVVDSTTAKKGHQQGQLSEAFLQAVSLEIPRNSWKWVFRLLMKSRQPERYLQDIESNYQDDLKEQKFQALLIWHRSMGDKATVAELDRALRECDCSNVADKCTKSVLESTRLQGGSSTNVDTDDKPHRKQEEKNRKITVLIENGKDTIQAALEGDTVTIRLPERSRGGIITDGQGERNTNLAVALLDSVINPLRCSNNWKMKLSDVAYGFEEKYGRKFKFRQLGVGKLKQFVKESEWFKLSTANSGEVYVEQDHPPPKHRPSLDSGLGVGDAFTVANYVSSSSTAIDDSSSESELEGYNTCASKPETPCPSPFEKSAFSTPLPFRSSPHLGETPWQPSPSKKCKARKNLFTTQSVHTPLYNFEKIDEYRLEALIGKPPSKCLKFRLEGDYSDWAVFSQDIVSMWNTPDRQSSYILVGVSANSSPPHDLFGLQESPKIDAHYQDYFLTDSFSYKPQFKYSETILGEKRFGVIVIPSSQGYVDDDGEPCPCYAEKNDPDGRWHQNDIWCCKPENSICARKATQKIIQWFSANQRPHQPGLQSKDPFSEESRQAWEMFKAQLGEFSQRRAYSLVLSRCSTEIKHLSALGNFKWVKVWDFDPESRDCGALNVCEPGMANRLRISTWNDVSEDSLSDAFTDWVFVRGLLTRDDSMVPTKKVREWSTKVNVPLNAHCKQLTQYCETKPLTVVVLWYDNWDYIPHLIRLLMKIDDNISDTKFVLCMPKLPGSEDHKANTHSLCEQIDIENVVEISLERLCYEIAHCRCPHQPNLGVKYKLPVAEGTGDSSINDRDASWLHQEIDVLYKDDTVSNQDIPHSEMGKEFFRGGLLGWTEAHLDIFDAKRSIYHELMSQLIGYIDKGTSTIVTLYHEPGAGGTTLSRRILWDLHTKTPCVCVTATTFRAREVYDRIDFLYEKTHLPIVILIDGKETCLINELFQRCQDCHILILCVQRYTREIGNQTHKGNHHWLRGKVDYKEAAHFACAFSSGCEAAKQRHMSDVVEEVKEGCPHYVYEFGLIAHAERYRGIISYVKGYLNLASRNLQPWQQAVGYLALATFYGHSSLPCQFFTGVFNMKQSELVTTDALTHNGRQFVLEDAKKLTWKITHHIVAKEILEQILSLTGRDEARIPQESTSYRLSTGARKGLAAFVMAFISYVSEQVQKKKFYDPTSAVMTVVRTICIHRDYKETGHDDVSQKKQRLSRMISDVYENTSVSEPYSQNEKLRVMQHLAKSFPEDPLFSAHLGRALGLFTNCYDEAIEHLDRARNLQMRQCQVRKRTYTNDESRREDTDSTLSTIYHIYGVIYHRKMIDLIGGGKLSKNHYTFRGKYDDLQTIIREVLPLAKVAVGHFKQCRHYCSKGMDDSYGYIGEIKLRLHFADFLEACYQDGFYAFLASPQIDSDVQEFAKSCFYKVDILLQQYQDKIGASDTDELDHCLNWYFVLFQDASTALQYWNEHDDIEGRRSKIAVFKIKHQATRGRGRQNYATILGSFQSKDDLQEVVKLYEKNIDEAYSASIPTDVSLDLRDWIFAIRHRLQAKIYSIEPEVLRRVQWCYDTSQQSYIALYYLYVLNTVLALGPKRLTKYFAESCRLLEKLKKMRGSLPKLQRLLAYEWIGVEKDRGIHELVHRSSLGTWDSELRFWKDHSVCEKLQIFRGTIVNCTNSLHGRILISTGNATGRHTLQAVFVPKVSDLYGKMHKNKEVEFFIGFNIEHGIGAYNVRELKRLPCNFCNTTVIVSALGMVSTCKKCHRVVSG